MKTIETKTGPLAIAQQTGEPDNAFAAFTLYLNMTPKRSTSQVAIRLGQSKSLVQQWASRWYWTARVTAHHEYIAAIKDQNPDPSVATPVAPESAAQTDTERHEEKHGPLPFYPERHESHKAFESFLCYFDLGVSRSFVHVARSMQASLGTVKLWAGRYDWAGRVRAYNTHLLRTRVTIETEARAKVATLWIDRTARFKEVEWETADKLIEGVRRHLDVILSTAPGQLSLIEIARTLEIASRIGRLSTGLTTGKAGDDLDDCGPLHLEFEAALLKIYGPVVNETPVVAENKPVELAPAVVITTTP